MKIVFLTIHSDPFDTPGEIDTGGQNIYIKNLSCQLSQKGHKIIILTRKNKWNKPNYQSYNGVKIYRIKSGGFHLIKEEVYPYLRVFFKKASKIIRNEKPDIIYSHYWMSGLVGMKIKNMLSIPLVHTYHSLGSVKYSTLEDNGFLYKTERLRLEKDLLKNSNLIITTSSFEKKELLKSINNKQKSYKEKVKIIYPIVDSKIFRPYNNSLSKNYLSLLFVGRPDKRKGLEETIKSITKLNFHQSNNFIRLLVVGNHKKRHSLTKEKHISYIGKIKNQELPKYYNNANLTIVPSYYEPFGIVALESHLCGTPVIASNVGGLREIVKHKVNGFLYTPKNFKALATAINNYKKLSPQEKKLFSINSRLSAVNKFNPEKILNKALLLFKSIL